MVKFNEENQKTRLKLIKEKEEEEVAKILSDKYDVPYADLSGIPIDLDYLKLISENQSREAKIAVFQGTGKKIKVAAQNPSLESTQNILKKLQENYGVEIFIVSTKSLERLWERYGEIPKFEELLQGGIEISTKRIEEFSGELTTTGKIKEIFLDRITNEKGKKISELLEIIISGALGINASDLHIEPQDRNVKIRMRIDGVLHDILEFEHKDYQLILSRIKLISEMKLNVKEQAQDGRFSIKTKNGETEVRTSSLPGPYGESIVLRILNPKTLSVAFENLGMQNKLQKIIEEEIKKPNGMILTTGPTGSGKTTTLYAFLNRIKSPETKIITIEEPIEYHLDGITQTQTNPNKGYDFANGLKSILRQDPDIIMVGEIRTVEAATTALNAALTGHLVFSTLHTNDSAGTIIRLIDLGAKPSVIAPAINVAIAQRLVRKLCDYCKKEYKPAEKELKDIKKVVDSFPETEKKPDINKIKLFKSAGCDKCSNIGYKNRTAIFEALLVDEKIEQLIFKNPSEAEIKERARKQNILNMQQDAVLKIINGTTSLEEVKRVIEI